MRIVIAILLLTGASAALAQSASSGEAIYNSICRACHGFPPAGGPETAGGAPAIIRGALNRVPAMEAFRFLSDAQVGDIAAYLASLADSTPPPPTPAIDYTDLWYGGESESGWGLNLIQHPSHVIFGVMYTYESPNRAAWFVLPFGEWTTPTIYSGTLYRVTGPPPTMSWQQSSVRAVGTATLAFPDASHGTFTFSVDGTQVSKQIIRQPF